MGMGYGGVKKVMNTGRKIKKVVPKSPSHLRRQAMRKGMTGSSLIPKSMRKKGMGMSKMGYAKAAISNRKKQQRGRYSLGM